MTIPEVGDRIRLVQMGPDPSPMEPGTTGTVRRVHYLPFAHSTQISVDWDVKRSLCLVIPPDVIEVIGKEVSGEEVQAVSRPVSHHDRDRKRRRPAHRSA